MMGWPNKASKVRPKSLFLMVAVFRRLTHEISYITFIIMDSPLPRQGAPV